MENTLFPSKSSFAVFVWLTICTILVINFGTPDKLFRAATDYVNHSLTRLLQIQTTALPKVDSAANTVYSMLQSLRVMSSANAAEPGIEGGIDVPFKSIADPVLPGPAAETKPTPVIKDGLQCMAENIYYEAGSQSYAGKIAVGQVVLNRVKSPSYPRTVCGVIYEGSQSPQTTTCQFSWTCQKRAPISKNSENWIQSLRAAKELLSNTGKTIDIVEGATSFHATSVKPVWAKKLKFVGQIDGHLFYSAR